MSYSQLFVLDKELKPAYIEDFKNSWLFPIPIFRYLINKYASEEEKEAARRFGKEFDGFDDKNPINPITFFMFDTGNEKFKTINSAINNSEDLTDRIGWELVNQQMFFAKHKEIIVDAIKKLQKLCSGDEERFSKVANEIATIDAEQHPFFIFKNNTIDDGVERYFSYYNEETEEEETRSLLDYSGELQFGLVDIEEDKMVFKEPLQGAEWTLKQ